MRAYLTSLGLGLGLLAFNCAEIGIEQYRRIEQTQQYKIQRETPSINPIPLYYYKFEKQQNQKRVIRLPPVDIEPLDGIKDENSIKYHIEVYPEEKPKQEEKREQKPRKFWFNSEEPFGSQFV